MENELRKLTQAANRQELHSGCSSANEKKREREKISQGRHLIGAPEGAKNQGKSTAIEREETGAKREKWQMGTGSRMKTKKGED
jgi:hypothetical protein